LIRKALTLLRNPRGVYHKYKSKLVRLFGGIAPIYGEDYDSHWGFTSFKGKVVLDLGADYGSTAHYFLRRGARRVVAVEGDPRLAEELEENFRGDGRVVPIHLFIEKAEQVSFTTPTPHHDIATRPTNDENDKRSTTIKVALAQRSLLDYDVSTKM
jgi:FkbM family methyltransferase